MPLVQALTCKAWQWPECYSDEYVEPLEELLEGDSDPQAVEYVSGALPARRSD